MKLRNTLLLGGVGAAAVTLLFLSKADAKYEEPQWSIVKKQGNIEVRRYPRMVAAAVTVDGTGGDAANKAFSILAGYIFGKNEGRRKIAMTVPVTEQMRSEKIAMTVPVTTNLADKKMTMKFFMPSDYDIENLPEALDKRIGFVVENPRAYATVRFSGLATEKSIRSHTTTLLEFINSSGLKVAGEPLTAFYNPPWTLPFLRRNEVWIPVELDVAG